MPWYVEATTQSCTRHLMHHHHLVTCTAWLAATAENPMIVNFWGNGRGGRENAQGAPSVVAGGGAVGAADLLKASAGECFTANMAAPPDELAAKVCAAATLWLTQWELRKAMLIGLLKATTLLYLISRFSIVPVRCQEKYFTIEATNTGLPSSAGSPLTY